MTTAIDLNADLGEGFGIWTLGDDDALLRTVSSANVACGFHGGDPSIMRRVCETAVANQVAIGAQVGYRDLAGFGRRRMEIDPADLEAEVLYQLGALDGFARVAGDRVRYVKPHGALYHAAAGEPEIARAVVAATRAFDPRLAVLGLPDSALLAAATDAGLVAVREAFADRAYEPTGELVPRGVPGAVLHEPDEIVARSLRLATTGTVVDRTGGSVEVRPRSLCVHGDTPGAAAIAERVRRALLDAGLEIAPFVPG